MSRCTSYPCAVKSSRENFQRRAGKGPCSGISSTGSTSGRLNMKAHIRFTNARANGLLSGEVTHCGEALARRALLRQQLRLPRHDGGDDLLVVLPQVAELVFLLRIVAQAGEREIALAEESGELMKVLLLPCAVELAVVALHAIHLHAEKRAADLARRASLRLGPFFGSIGRRRRNSTSGIRRPDALRVDQRAGDLIVRAVCVQRIARATRPAVWRR